MMFRLSGWAGVETAWSGMCRSKTTAAPPTAERAGEPVVASRRNYVLGVLSGSAGTVAIDFLHPELILAGLIYALTRSATLVALVTVVSKAGVLAPQMLVGTGLEHRARKRPYFIALTAVRATALAAMIGAMGRLSAGTDPMVLGLFFLAYFISCMAAGASYVIFMDMAGRMVPSERIGSFFGMRHGLGGVLSVVLGFALIQPVLEKIDLPLNYLVLAVVGAVLAVASMVLFALCHEEPGPQAPRRTTVGESLRRGFGWLRRDRNYRAYLWQRVCFRVSYLALAFYIPYGSETLATAGGPGGLAVLGGIMVATFKLSRTVFSVLWGRVADVRGFRACMIGGGVFFSLAPGLALLAPHLPGAYALPIPATQSHLDLRLSVYLLSLVSLGGGFQGMIIGSSRFLITSAPPHRRISYVGFLNTVTSPLTLMPLAGAWLAARAGMHVLFAVVLVGGLLSLLAATRMRPERAAEGPPPTPPEPARPA